LTHANFWPDFLHTTLVFPAVAVAPAFVHEPPTRTAPDVDATAVVVVFDEVPHVAQLMPAVFSASPGLSA
jgi:hypothetical protein